MEITLETIEDFSLQEIFNYVKDHLLSQNFRSVSQSGDCVYKNNAGLKCAVGVFIPETQYNPEIEGRDVNGIFAFYNISISEDIWKLLADLQRIHDVYHPHEWERLLEIIAKRYKLKYQDEKNNIKNNQQILVTKYI